MKLAPIDTLKHLPFLRGGRAEEPGVTVVEVPEEPPLFYTDPEPDVSNAANQIEAAHRKLVDRSDHIRLGLDPHPIETIQSLAHAADILAASDAPEWEKALVLGETAANLHGGGYGTHPTVQQIAHQAMTALHIANPEVPDDEYKTRLNKDEVSVRKGAILRTNPQVSFSEAVEQEWTAHQRPLEVLIDSTGQAVLEADKELARQEEEKVKAAEAAELAVKRAEAAKRTTGILEKFDPFADDEEDESAA